MSEKWDNRMLALAELVAAWSKDPSTQVGAVIVDSLNRVVSLGFNGLPRGTIDAPTMSRDEKLLRTIHAEDNALLFGGREVRGCTMYVTHHPCARCASKIVQAGIGAVVHAGRPLRPSWAQDVALATATFSEAGVPVREAPHAASAAAVWREIADEARAVVMPASGGKALVLTEAMCIRLGSALGL